MLVLHPQETETGQNMQSLLIALLLLVCSSASLLSSATQTVGSGLEGRHLNGQYHNPIVPKCFGHLLLMCFLPQFAQKGNLLLGRSALIALQGSILPLLGQLLVQAVNQENTLASQLPTAPWHAQAVPKEPFPQLKAHHHLQCAPVVFQGVILHHLGLQHASLALKTHTPLHRA